jgi:bacterioferritin-associated ferredoxin
MVVCVCNAIREKDLRKAAEQGVTSASEAYALLGRRPKCGQCFRFAESLLTDLRQPA